MLSDHPSKALLLVWVIGASWAASHGLRGHRRLDLLLVEDAGDELPDH